MSIYSLVQSALMRMDPEDAHTFVIRLLKHVSRHRSLTAVEIILADRVPKLPVEQLDLKFKVPVGLAAGFDKDGLAYPALAGIGFGFIEIGTVTPRRQRGNPRPRIFRIENDAAIINRMGFNSCGLDQFVVNLGRFTKFPKSAVLGVNIGKNSDTPNERAIDDFVRCYKGVYPYADYIAINVSSPNSPGLRDLQNSRQLDELLGEITQLRSELTQANQSRNVPLALKISPDIDSGQIRSLITIAAERGVDAIIATNTTTARPANLTHELYKQNGGLSGTPLRARSTEVIQRISEISDNSMTIIGCGGITTAQDAWDKFMAGADLVQVYSSMIYQSTTVVKKIVTGLAELAQRYDSESFSNAISLARKSQ